MKKIFNISILLMLTLAFFVSCGHATDGNTNEISHLDTTPLFDESETSVTMNNSLTFAQLSDGTWEYKRVYTTVYSNPFEINIYMQDWSHETCNIISTYTNIISLRFSISGGIATYLSQSETNEYTMDDENKAKLINFAASHNQPLTWNGNTVKITKTLPADNGYLNNMFEQSSYSTFTTKKNEAGTRYLVKLVHYNTTLHYLKKLD
jgi:hypothetical protein